MNNDQINSYFKEYNLKEYDNYFKIIKNSNWKPFYNHGYLSLDNKDFFNYDKIDKCWSFQCNLYSHLLQLIDFNKDSFLLDVGCGLGHGAYIYNKYYELNNITAIDVHKDNIEFAKNNFNGINYLVGDATKLSFKDNVFDIITSIETLHCYRYTYHFYKEAYRVLKTNGHLLVTDLYVPYKDDNVVEDFFNRSGFWIKEKINITKQVLLANIKNKETFAERFKHVDKKAIDYFINIIDENIKEYTNKNKEFITYVLLKLR
jgi:ubiquinone/menaquinone biosynthesis C-methylase UbiE